MGWLWRRARAREPFQGPSHEAIPASSATCSPMARDAVSPGDSMPYNDM